MRHNAIPADVALGFEERENPAPPTRFSLVPFGDIRLSTERAYLVKGLVPREGLVVIWGPPKCGKSFWTFDLAMHVALGREYRERRIQQGPVVYIALEGERGLGARVEAFRQHHLAEDVGAVPFYLLATSLDLAHDASELIEDVRKGVDGQKPVAIVVDTLNRSLSGSESSDEDMGAYVKAVDRVRTAFGCAVLVIHHSGIEASRPRGHTSLTGAADAQLSVKRGEDGQVLVKVEFMKDGAEGDELASSLEIVEVGTDDDGEAITSCVIQPAGTVEARRGRPRGRAGQALLQLERAIEDAGERLPSGGRFPTRTTSAVRVDLWKDYCRRASVVNSDNPDSFRRAFDRHAEKLKELGAVCIWDGWAWLPDNSDKPGQEADKQARTLLDSPDGQDTPP